MHDVPRAGVVTTAKKRRIADYARVSSEEQRERETIKTQADELASRHEQDSDVEIVERIFDDGVSGTISIADRPGGSRLLRLMEAHAIDELWVYNISRLGRDAVDLLWFGRRLEFLGIRLVSLQEGVQDNLLGFDVNAVVADSGRRTLLKNSADGMNRAAREGRYLGGIVPLGYRVDGARQNARLAPSDIPMWRDLTEADVARLIFQRLVEGWSCTKIAVEFNALGIPTAYGQAGRGIRGRRTQEVWRPNRIYSLATSTIYRGEQRFGVHSRNHKGREIISASVPRLVSDEVWYAAQETLHGNNIIPDGKRTVYLLRGLMRCDTCGQGYYGAPRGESGGSYRCGGQLVSRRLECGRCIGKSIHRGTIEGIVWNDIERFLRDPGDLLRELEAESSPVAGAAAVAEADRMVWASRLDDLAQQRSRALDLHIRGRMPESDLDAALDRIEQELRIVQARLWALGSKAPSEQVVTPDVLAEIRARIDAGLTPEQRQEIARLLVKRITVHTDIMSERKKMATARIEYLFPRVVPSHTASRWPPGHPSPRCRPPSPGDRLDPVALLLVAGRQPRAAPLREIGVL